MRRASLVAVLLLLLLAACTAEPPDPAVRPASPEVATSVEGTGDALAFSAPTLDGGTVEGGEFAGQDLMLWFWAPWCTTCNREAPEVAQVVQLLDDDQVLVGVAGRDAQEAMVDFVDRHDLQDLVTIADVSGEVWDRFGVVGQPSWAFIDGDTGRVSVRFGALGQQGVLDAFDADGFS